MEDVLAKMGLKGIHLITGLLGGCIGLIYGKKVRTWRDKLKAVLIVLSGAIVTGYVTPLILVYKPNWIGAEYSIAFVVGIFGMSIIKDVFSFLYEFGKSPLEYLKMFRSVKK